MQSHDWSKVKSSWTWEAVVVRGEDGRIKGSMALLIRKMPLFPITLMYCPRGPVCDLRDRETVAQLVEGAKAVAKKYRSFDIKIDPDVKSDDTEFREMMESLGFRLPKDTKNFEAIQPRYVFRMDVKDKTEEETMASFQSKVRYNIRLAQRKGVQVRLCGKEMLGVFHEIMLETGVRDGFVIRSKEYFEQLLDAMGEHARLYMAFVEDKPVAGTLAMCYGNKTWYLYGASSNEYRNYMPNYLLQWEMIRWALEMHCDVYDFRGVSGDLSEDNPLYGLYKFKKGFNGEFTEFVGEMDLITHKFLYFCINKAQRAFRSTRAKVFLRKHRNDGGAGHAESGE